MRSVTRKEAAVILRKRLAAAFPRTKFSVRCESFAGGGSIRVAWTDGPSMQAVEDIAGQYRSARFDSSTDYASTVNHWLYPDGSTEVYGGEPSKDGAEPVSFGNTYIGCSRSISEAVKELVHKAYSALTVEERCSLWNKNPRLLSYCESRGQYGGVAALLSF